MARFGDFDQYLDNAGEPLVEGKLYFYESGTTTPKTTFADINNSIPNTNPVLLSAAGRQPNIFFDGVAKCILANNSDVQIAVRDPVGETDTDFGDQWVATKIYSATDVVLGSDGTFYRSLINGNQNNNPVTTTGYWTLLYSVEWNQGITYKVGAVVTYEGNTYQSLQNSNLNQNPASVTAYWAPLAFAWLATRTYAIHENVVGTDGILYTSLQNSNLNKVPASSSSWWVGTSAAAAASAVAAAASAAASASSATDSANSATASASSATDSANSATASASSATNSANSATASANSATASATSATASAASAAAAATSETNAATSASNSATSATESATSAAAALVSENAAASSETAAAASESAAATSATNSATSASQSATSATASASSATASASSATDSANSATASAGSATAASGSATAAAGSATAAASSATDAATAETGAEAALEEFEELYLGAKSTAPTVDNQGNPLQAGALYFNTVSNTMFVYSGSSWAAAGSAVNGTAERQEYVATSGQTTFSATYDVGFVDVYLNGSKLIPTTDFTATNGATIVLGTGAVTGDNVSIIAYGAFNVADTYTQAQADAKFAQVANNLSDLDSAATALTNLGLTATATELNTLDGITATTTELNYTDGVTSNIQAQIDNIDALPSQTGNNGLFLTTDGSTASWGEVSGGAWSVVEEITASAASTIDIESFTTDYDIYKILFTLEFSNTTSHPLIRLKVGGSYQTSGYAYLSILYNPSNGSSYTQTRSTSSSRIQPSTNSFTAGDYLWGCIEAGSVNQSGQPNTISYDINYTLSAVPQKAYGIAQANTDGALEGVRIYGNVAGTLTGKVIVLGLNNSAA